MPFAAFTCDDRYRRLAAALRSALKSANLSPAEAAEIRYELGRVLMVMEEFETGWSELAKAVPQPPRVHRPARRRRARHRQYKERHRHEQR
ncbi:hypothetical protein [Nonomuraea sp. NPDC002799]